MNVLPGRLIRRDREQIEREVEEELRFHLELLTEAQHASDKMEPAREMSTKSPNQIDHSPSVPRQAAGKRIANSEFPPRLVDSAISHAISGGLL